MTRFQDISQYEMHHHKMYHQNNEYCIMFLQAQLLQIQWKGYYRPLESLNYASNIIFVEIFAEKCYSI